MTGTSTYAGYFRYSCSPSITRRPVPGRRQRTRRLSRDTRCRRKAPRARAWCGLAPLGWTSGGDPCRPLPLSPGDRPVSGLPATGPTLEHTAQRVRSQSTTSQTDTEAQSTESVRRQRAAGQTDRESHQLGIRLGTPPLWQTR